MNTYQLGFRNFRSHFMGAQIFQISTLENPVKIFAKQYLFFLEVQFHHEGGLSRSRYLELFSQDDLYFHHAENQPLLRPPSTSSEH